MTVVQGTINCASLLTGSRSKEEMGGIARARDKDIILKSIAFVCRGDPSASLLLTNEKAVFWTNVTMNSLCNPLQCNIVEAMLHKQFGNFQNPAKKSEVQRPTSLNIDQW